MTNKGVVPTRFTITTTTSSSSTSHPESSLQISTGDRKEADPAEGSDRRRDDQAGVTRGETDPRADSCAEEAELMEKASAVGDAGMKYQEGKGAIEVMDGGGELAGYGSTEIVVVFAPLTVGEFRTVKVGLRKRQSLYEFPCEVPLDLLRLRCSGAIGRAGVLRGMAVENTLDPLCSSDGRSEVMTLSENLCSWRAPFPHFNGLSKRARARATMSTLIPLDLSNHVLPSRVTPFLRVRPFGSRVARRSSSLSWKRRAHRSRYSRRRLAPISAAAFSANCT